MEMYHPVETVVRNEEADGPVSGSNSKKEEATGLSQIIAANSDTKSSIDSKSTQVRLVRGTKRMRIDLGESSQVNDKKEVKEDDNVEAKVVKSFKRSCELWSMENKNTFFKALNEFGKDFDALQSYFLNQGKKKGLPENMIKNKEQIRHFYYRTWLKISKHLKFSEDVKKASQELYGLINYGELRRKLPPIHEKVHLKLNELIYWGSTQVRLRGKTMRVKTPICRALRKLNQLEDWQEEVKLPSRVTIELRPGNNMSWWQVQALAMNPRVRTLVPIQRRLSSLLTFLQQRWRPVKYKASTNMENEVNDDLKDVRLLRVAPPEGCKITLPVVNLGEYLTSSSVSLNSYEKRFGLKSSKVELLGPVHYLKGVSKKGIKRCKTDKRLSNRTDDHLIAADNNSDIDTAEPGLHLAENSPIVNNPEKSTLESSTGPNRFPGRETVARIRLGWNIEETNTITVGDLYLMFGRDSKITLEYWWDPILPELQTRMSENPKTTNTSHDNSLCLALQKLLSIAKHSYGASKVYDNTSGSNETVISSRIPSTKESTFRRPLIPQTYKIGTPDAFKTQLDKFKSRFCKRGRTVRQKSLVVQRVLPAAFGAAVSPEITVTSASEVANTNTDNVNVNSNAGENIQTATTVADNPQGKHFLDALASVEQAKPSNSIITSATQILKEGEHQWLNSEVADFSLSSFLGQLESPIKGSQRSQLGGHPAEEVRSSSDVVTHMQCLMGESSVDYMAKFANLASQIASDEHKK